MMATPATALSCGSNRFKRRPTSLEAHSPDEGMTCMTPIALAGETDRMSKPDSTYAWARASLGSTPICAAVERTISCIWAREGTAALSRASLLAFAAELVESG